MVLDPGLEAFAARARTPSSAGFFCLGRAAARSVAGSQWAPSRKYLQVIPKGEDGATIVAKVSIFRPPGQSSP